MCTFIRPYRVSSLWTIVVLFVALALGSVQAQVVDKGNEELSKIDIDERLGDTLPLDLQFVNASGQAVTLADYFQQGKPVIFTLGYYECPMLCNLVFNGLVDGINRVDLKPGVDYTLLTVSIDPLETPDLAYAKKKNYLKSIEKQVDESAWAFLTGQEEEIQKLSDAVGFRFFYDESRDEYAHPAVAMLVSDQGVVSRYLYGVEFKTNDLKLGLLEAAEGKIGSTVDRIILYCFHYDPDAKGYVLFATNVMKLGGAGAATVLGLVIGGLFVAERRRKHKRNETEEDRHTGRES